MPARVATECSSEKIEHNMHSYIIYILYRWYSYAEYYTVSVGMEMIIGQIFNTVLIEQMLAKSAVLVEATLAVAALRLATSSWN